MARYIGLIEGTVGAYGIHFPDLPGCTSIGSTIEETIFNGADAMRDWVELTEESGVTIPPPRDFEAMRNDSDVILTLKEGATVATVPLVRSTGRPSKANLSIDSGSTAAFSKRSTPRPRGES